jgi:hypothetical protein
MKPQPQKSGCHRKIVQAAASSRRSPRRLRLLDKDKDARRLQAADVLLRAASVVRTDSGKAPLLLEPWRQCCKYGPQTTTRTVPACIPISWHVRHPVRYLSVRLLRYVPRTSGIPTLLWYAQVLGRALPGACLHTPLRSITKPCMCYCIPTQKDIVRGARVDDDIIVHLTCNEITSSISIYPDWLRLTQHHPRYQNSIGVTQLYRKIVQVSVTVRTPRATLARAKS